MSFADSLFFWMLLVAGSVFFTLRDPPCRLPARSLQVMADEWQTPRREGAGIAGPAGQLFTVVQIGLNTVAILGGILGNPFNPAIRS